MYKIIFVIGQAAGLAACGNQGYGPTDSYSARYGSNATASTEASHHGSSSTSVEAQRQKIYNKYE